MFKHILLPLAACSVLGACAPTFEARVNRFQALPAPSGQTFAVAPVNGARAGSLEFATYANLVSRELTRTGYTQVADAKAANLLVKLDYGVTPPRERIETRPGFGYGGLGYGGFGYGGFGRYGGGFGYGRFGRGYWGGYGGFYDPFWSQPEVYSVTQYNGFVSVRIDRVGDGTSVFEGRAETISRTNDLTQLVPNLVTAVFTNFPGNSGETVRVKFDPRAPQAATSRPVTSTRAPG